MNVNNKPAAMTKERQIAIAASSWHLTAEDREKCDIVLEFLVYLPNVNPDQLLRTVNVRYVPINATLSKYAELYFPSNSRTSILIPREPIEESATLIKIRKHICGKYVALVLPVWNFQPDCTTLSLDIAQLEGYNDYLSILFSRREVI